VTARVHGPDTATRVIAASAILFGGTSLAATTPDVLEVLEGEVPTAPVALAELSAGMSLVDALVTAGLASSKADARRGLQQKGFSVNGTAVEDAGRSLTDGDLLGGRYIMLQKGRKNYAMLVAT
jgi:tyrosyl-tRNA synthetase